MCGTCEEKWAETRKLFHCCRIRPINSLLWAFSSYLLPQAILLPHQPSNREPLHRLRRQNDFEYAGYQMIAPLTSLIGRISLIVYLWMKYQ